MLLSTLIRVAENGVNMLAWPATSAAATDKQHYDTAQLSKGERRQALALLADQAVPEGSILLVSSGVEDEFDVVVGPEEVGVWGALNWCAVRGLDRGERTVEKLLENADWAGIDAVVVPGCGSSPLGAAALAKTVAQLYQTDGTPKQVAAIVAGQGSFDKWLEAASGGLVMAPMANALHMLDPLLELTARMNPFLARAYLVELLDVMHEAATLYALLKARLVDRTLENLNLVVSHSKGNWAVLVALLTLELDLTELAREGNLDGRSERISVVTFGNPVNLPNMRPFMKKLFHYHQFFGAADRLAHTCSTRAWWLRFDGMKELDPRQPTFDASLDPNERIVAKTGHHLVADLDPETDGGITPRHMPIELVLPQILRQ